MALDCFVASLLAMTAKRHASSPPRRVAPEFCFTHHPLQRQRAQGRPGGRCTRGPRAEKNCASASPQVQAVITPAFPARWFDGLYVISPVNLADCHRHPREAWQLRLDLSAEPLGRQDHTISPYADAPLVNRRPRPPHPASRVVTFAIRPSWLEAGWTHQSTISDKRKAIYFCAQNLNEPSRLIPFGKFVPPRTRFRRSRGPS